MIGYIALLLLVCFKTTSSQVKFATGLILGGLEFCNFQYHINNQKYYFIVLSFDKELYSMLITGQNQDLFLLDVNK